MGRLVTVPCDRCGGAKLDHICTKCSGSGTVTYYVDEDEHYTELF